MEQKSFLKKNYRLFAYILLFAAIAFLHIFMINSLPKGLNVDEIGSAVDAYSLSKFGVDRWGKSWPVYMTNYRDGQNILYTYLLVPVFKIFGANIYTVRSVIIAASFIAALFGSLFMKEVHEDSDADLLFLLLFAASPVFTIAFRFGLESHLFMCVSTVMIYLLARAVKKGRAIDYILFGIVSGINLYTYALSYFTVTAFLLISVIYLIIQKKVKVLNVIEAAVPYILLAIPLVIVQIINMFDLPEMKIGIFTFTKLPKYRSGELEVAGFFKKIFCALFSTLLYDDTGYNSLKAFPNFQYITIPFIALGFGVVVFLFIKSLKKKEFNALSLPLFWAFVMYLMAGFTENSGGYQNITRMNGVLIAPLIFATEGLFFLLNLKKIAPKAKKALVITVTLVYSALLILFGIYYFTKYDEKAYPYKWLFFEEYPEEALEYLENPENGFEDAKVYLPFVYSYYLWWTKASPYDTGISIAAGEDDPSEIGRFSMKAIHNLNGEFMFYRFGYSEPEVDLYRRWHFKEQIMGSYYLLTDPFDNADFFRGDLKLSDSVTVKKAYIDIEDDWETAKFYGWLEFPEGIGDKVSVNMENDDGIKNADIIGINNDGKEVVFMFEFDYESCYQSEKKLFNVYLNDENDTSLLSSNEILE